jgi:hypothetical protein
MKKRVIKKKPAAAKARAGGNTGRAKGSKRVVRIYSLGPALADDEKRRLVCQWFYADGLSQPDCVKKIAEVFGIHTTERALKYFIHQYRFPWKVEEAKAQAEIEKGRLPVDWDSRVREALAQRKFVAVFDDLTHQQLVAFEKMDLEKQKIDLKSAQIYLTERRQALAEKKAEALEEVAALPAISPAEEAQRIQRILGQE